MASELQTVTYICDQSGLSDQLSYRKMFGEYALYLRGKVVAFVCDDQLFVKPTPQGRAVIGNPKEAPPYPGAKLYFLLDVEVEDRDLLREVLEVTEAALPMPKPKSPKKRAQAAGPR